VEQLNGEQSNQIKAIAAEKVLAIAIAIAIAKAKAKAIPTA